jgi:O-antigen/teichoic acid export membrane protein
LHSIDAQTPRRQLRSFAFIFAGVFIVIALWPTIFRWEAPRLWPLVPAGLFVAWGLLHPDSLQKPFRAWMKFGGFLGRINSKIILSAVFFVIITPIRIVMAVFGYDPMNRKLDPKADTYRVPRQPRPPSHMSRQF